MIHKNSYLIFYFFLAYAYFCVCATTAIGEKKLSMCKNTDSNYLILEESSSQTTSQNSRLKKPVMSLHSKFNECKNSNIYCDIITPLNISVSFERGEL